MTAFRIFLAVIFIILVGYTLPVLASRGPNLFAVFFGDIMQLGWRGQFNLDFMGMLMLAGVWVAWRHEFRPAGLALGALAFFFGAPFLTAYLLIHSFRTEGDMARLLLGDARAGQARKSGQKTCASSGDQNE